MKISFYTNEITLIIGPCGAGKSTYALQHFKDRMIVDYERIMRTFFADPADFRFYPALRAVTGRVCETAVLELAAKKVSFVRPCGGCTKKERKLYIDLAKKNNMLVRVIHLTTDPETCIARAKSDPNRPKTSRSAWKSIVENYFRTFEPVSCEEEGIASYFVLTD